MSAKTISKLFVVAGLSNVLGVLLLSKGFTNQVMMDTQPEVMGYFGLIGIVLWGFAYIAVSKSYASVPWLIAVFTIEKLAYVIVYLQWFTSHSITTVYEQDTLAGVFYSIYGLNDFLFMLFFGWVFIRLNKSTIK
ncbi:hypothetical protein DCS32_01775 [Dokdonia sp. Dokd-P16]|uniref:hypothetical protein n=1 Tax=Dokdonia sp. Dokd-P16 TaxID=2173169 RepID=UPI000D5430B2|nr:hypothetical protein [Dokdonia sp. Dokd-P16]AWH72934.1 hypothetical protein DCS32_01775 [Dokdonia sp. Dokd-P16]